MSNLQATVESLLADVDMIGKARLPESVAPSAEPAEDTVMATLFSTFEIPPPPPREHDKRHRGGDEDEARTRKKECCEMEASRRASLSYGEARQMRAVELAAGASSSKM